MDQGQQLASSILAIGGNAISQVGNSLTSTAKTLDSTQNPELVPPPAPPSPPSGSSYQPIPAFPSWIKWTAGAAVVVGLGYLAFRKS